MDDLVDAAVTIDITNRTRVRELADELRIRHERERAVLAAAIPRPYEQCFAVHMSNPTGIRPPRQTGKGAELAPYHFSVTVHGDFSTAVERTKRALADQGFGIVSEIDMAAILREKLGVERAPYVILGACNPGFARSAVDSEPAIGVLLPCNVVVRTTEGDGVVIDFMDPAVMIDLVGERRVHDIAEDVRARLEMARDAVATRQNAA